MPGYLTLQKNHPLSGQALHNIHTAQIESRVVCLSAAVVPKERLTVGRFVQLDFPTWQTDTFQQFRISPNGRWTAPGISLEEITQLLKPNVQIIIKMDIEGGELPLLDELLGLLRNVQTITMLFMEFHGTVAQMNDWVTRLEGIGFSCTCSGFIMQAKRTSM